MVHHPGQGHIARFLAWDYFICDKKSDAFDDKHFNVHCKLTTMEYRDRTGSKNTLVIINRPMCVLDWDYSTGRVGGPLVCCEVQLKDWVEGK